MLTFDGTVNAFIMHNDNKNEITVHTNSAEICGHKTTSASADLTDTARYMCAISMSYRHIVHIVVCLVRLELKLNNCIVEERTLKYFRTDAKCAASFD